MQESQEVSILTMAINCLEEANQDVNAAYEKFMELVLNDARIQASLLEEACWGKIGQAVRAVNKKNVLHVLKTEPVEGVRGKRVPSRRRPENTMQGKIEIARTRRNLFGYQLPNRTLLGDATAEDVEDAKRVHLQNVGMNQKKADLMDDILIVLYRKKNIGKTVRESLSAERVEKLFRKHGIE